ncbi:MAG: hypothetical protein ACLFQO_15530 [Cyclobacteriaceae bacterium]
MKAKLILLFSSFWAIGVFLNEHYRPYVYQNSIQDFGLADVAGNLISPCAICFIVWFMRKKLTSSVKLDIALITLVYLLHEILSIIFPFLGTFDIKDMVALTIGGAMSYGFYHLLDIESYYSQKNQKLSV